MPILQRAGLKFSFCHGVHDPVNEDNDDIGQFSAMRRLNATPVMADLISLT